MEYIVICVVSLISIAVLKYVFDYNKKIIEHIGDDEELDRLAKDYPDNIEICKEYLKKLGNENVSIEEDRNSQTSLYIAVSNKIYIANIQNTYTRIQTIAHECLHSIQEKKILLFNFIFSNIYLIYFVVICILAFTKILPYRMMFLLILMVMSLIYYSVRIYLESDAMIKARYLAKDYIEEKKVSTRQEIDKIVAGFDKINKIGTKCVCYHFFFEIMMKVFIFSMICLIRI